MTQKKQIDYNALFSMGITFLGIGVVFMISVNKVLGLAFLVIGAINMIIGGKNKDKWKKWKNQ